MGADGRRGGVQGASRGHHVVEKPDAHPLRRLAPHEVDILHVGPPDCRGQSDLRRVPVAAAQHVEIQRTCPAADSTCDQSGLVEASLSEPRPAQRNGNDAVALPRQATAVLQEKPAGNPGEPSATVVLESGNHIPCCTFVQQGAVNGDSDTMARASYRLAGPARMGVSVAVNPERAPATEEAAGLR